MSGEERRARLKTVLGRLTAWGESMGRELQMEVHNSQSDKTATDM